MSLVRCFLVRRLSVSVSSCSREGSGQPSMCNRNSVDAAACLCSYVCFDAV